MKLKKGDKVVVLAGKDKGQRADIIKVLRESNQVVLEGLNIKKKHVRATSQEEGQIVDIAAPINASNVALIDPKTDKATRVGIDRSGKTPVRVSKKSNSKLD